MNGPWDREPPPPPPARPPSRLGLWLGLIAALGAIVLALARAFPEAVTTPQDWTQVAYSAGLVVLVSAGLMRSGRVLRPEHLRYAALWAGIIAVLALGFASRDELEGEPRQLQLDYDTGEGVATADHELVIPQDEDGGFMVVGRVNGQRVRRAALLPNDMLSVANVKYRVLFGIDLEPEPLPDEKPQEPNDLPEIPLQRNLHPDVYPEAKTPPG